MVMSWFFAVMALIAVFIATFAKHLRRAILALWIAGLAVGSIYLTIGAEFLAITQWIVSTLITISFLFFAVMFGEYHPSEIFESQSQFFSKNTFFLLCSLVLGLGFGGLIWIGTKELPFDFTSHEWFDSAGAPLTSELEKLGIQLTQNHLLTLEVLALMLLLVLVGGGVVARLEGDNKK